MRPTSTREATTCPVVASQFCAERRATAAAADGLPQAHLISSHTGEGVAPLLEKLWKLIATERTDEPVLHG